MTQVSVRAEADAQIRASGEEARAYRSPYERWKESQGIPGIRGFVVPNVFEAEVAPWKERGGSGTFVNLDGAGGFNDAYIYELRAKESSVPIKHIYDELVLILSGQGATTVYYEENRKQTFEWKKGSWFAIPINAWHQHHNLSGDEPARYFAMTSAPRVIDTFQNLDFVFNNPYRFTDRFNDDEGYFKQAERQGRGQWQTNYIADVFALAPKNRASAQEIEESARAGAMSIRGNPSGGIGRESDAAQMGAYGGQVGMVNGTVRCGIAYGAQPGVHTMAHRHGPGIHVLTLKGHGYSLLWPDGASPRRVEWGPGTVFVPPEMWWHAHFNIGPEPWDWLRIGWGSDKPKLGGGQYDYSLRAKDGGDSMFFDEEDPAIHHEFEEALAEAGTKCLMLHHPACSRS